MSGEDGALKSLRSGSVWVDLTTNRKELGEKLVQAAPAGVSVVDCPVTGAVDGARNGKLTLFIGGDDATAQRVLPVLQQLGEVIHCGPLGTGNVVKLVTNQLWFIAAAAIGEGFATGIANGVELRVLWSAIKNSVGDSFVVRHDAPSIFFRSLRPFVLPGFVPEGSGSDQGTGQTSASRIACDRCCTARLRHGSEPLRPAGCRIACRS